MAANKAPNITTVRHVNDVSSLYTKSNATPAKNSFARKLLRKPKNNMQLFLTGVVILLIIALVFMGIRYNAQQRKIELLANPQAASEQQQSELVNKIGKIVELPKDESPLVVAVENAAKLKDQPFFVDAKDGDKVLVYSKSKLAVLYRPSTNKVIQASRVSLNSVNQ